MNCTMADFLGLGMMQREICNWRDGTRTNPKHTETPNTQKPQTHRTPPPHTQNSKKNLKQTLLFRWRAPGALQEAFCRKHRVKSVVQAQGLAHSWLLPKWNRRAGEGGASQAWGRQVWQGAFLQREWRTFSWNGLERIKWVHLERNGGCIYSPPQAGTCFLGGWKVFPFLLTWKRLSLWVSPTCGCGTT